MMKSLLLATAAVATFAAAPALAQDAAGSIGIQYSNTDADGSSEELETWSLNGVTAMPAFGAWTVTLAADVSQVEFLGEDDSSVSGSVGLSTLVGGDMRVGGFVAASDAGDETAVTGGFRAQKYLSKATLTGAVAYTDVFDTNIWSLSADASFYVTPALSLNAGISYDTVDDADLDAWTYGVGAEYDIGSTPFAVTGGVARTNLDFGGFDADVDTWTLGVRYTFGGGKQARDRAGATVPAAGISSLLGAI